MTCPPKQNQESGENIPRPGGDKLKRHAIKRSQFIPEKDIGLLRLVEVELTQGKGHLAEHRADAFNHQVLLAHGLALHIPSNGH